MSNSPRDNFPISRLAFTSAGGSPFFVLDHEDGTYRKLTMAELRPKMLEWEAKHRAEVAERVASKIAKAQVPAFEEMLYSVSTVVVSKPKFKVYVDKENVGAGLARQARVKPVKRRKAKVAGPEPLPECVAKCLAQRRTTTIRRAPLGTVSKF